MTAKLNQNIDIRRAIPSDVQAMKKCAEAAYQHYTNRIGKAPAPMFTNYLAVVSKDGAFVAEINSRLVGMLVLSVNANEIVLDNIAVLPEYQGIGIGGKIIQFAEDEARRRGFHLIKLYTNEAMKENLALYAHMGYVETDKRNENGYQRVYMQKNLNK